VKSAYFCDNPLVERRRLDNEREVVRERFEIGERGRDGFEHLGREHDRSL
jgi:hypothetical protein